MKTSKRIKINSIFLGIILILLSINYLLINITISNNEKVLKTKLNNEDQLLLLHSYDFEDDVVGQIPTGITLSVNDPVDSGSVKINNLGDEQQNHVALHKSGGSKSIRLTDNISYYGNTYEVGELHFKFYHDNSLFGIHLRDSYLPGLSGILFAIDLWNGIVGRYGVGISYTTYALNQWIEFIIYYNIYLGWMFEIDGIRYGDGYSFSFENENPSGVEFINWGSAYSGGGDGYLRLDDIAFYYYGSKPSILIDDSGAGDYTWSEASAQTWCTGEGIPNNPYIIENLIIDGGEMGSCLEIRNSDAFFIIRNCTVYNSGKYYPNAGIKLQKVSNGLLINNYALNNDYGGIVIFDSNNNIISGNTISENNIGIYLHNSYNNTVSGNIVNMNSLYGIFLYCSNCSTITGNTVSINEIGIDLIDSNYNTISGNNVNINEIGILIDSCDNIIISGNVINYNEIGISLRFSNSTLLDNIFSGNNQDIDTFPKDVHIDRFHFEIVIIIVAITIIMIFTVMIILRKRSTSRRVFSDEDKETLFEPTGLITSQEEKLEESVKKKGFKQLYCHECGSKLEPDVSICSYCGAIIKDNFKDSENF